PTGTADAETWAGLLYSSDRATPPKAGPLPGCVTPRLRQPPILPPFAQGILPPMVSAHNRAASFASAAGSGWPSGVPYPHSFGRLAVLGLFRVGYGFPGPEGGGVWGSWHIASARAPKTGVTASSRQL